MVPEGEKKNVTSHKMKMNVPGKFNLKSSLRGSNSCKNNIKSPQEEEDGITAITDVQSHYHAT